ncbi:MAG: glycosyltransferase family 2 protein [Pseudomonadota bacterium]|nr:glycosyltransferase family 2 protein [Pseudomonadota bacterium]
MVGNSHITVVVPLYNEADCVDRFFERIEPVLDGLGGGYDIVCVDDGSSDDTLARLVAHRTRNPAIKVLGLSRNFGKDIALSAGLDHAHGDAVVIIDADMQDPPELIPEFYAKWREGYEVAYGTRTSRTSDTLAKRTSASWFYRLYNRLTDVPIPSDAGDFRLLDRRVVEALRRLPERNRFMKGLYAWAGFRQIGVTYSRAPREAGTTKWGYWKLWNFALDGITSFSSVPLRVWTYVGLLISIIAFSYASYLVLRTLIVGVDVPGYASLMVSVLLIGGLNLFTLGIIGEYLGRMYTEVKGRPLYVVRDCIGFDGADDRSHQAAELKPAASAE